MANRTTRTPEKEAVFLASLRNGRSIAAACGEACIARRSAYDWRENDGEFKSAWDDAVEEGTDRLEDIAFTRAADASDTLLIFLLKARRRQKFGDKQVVEHGGKFEIGADAAFGDLVGALEAAARLKSGGTGG